MSSAEPGEGGTGRRAFLVLVCCSLALSAGGGVSWRMFLLMFSSPIIAPRANAMSVVIKRFFDRHYPSPPVECIYLFFLFQSLHCRMTRGSGRVGGCVGERAKERERE